jgi:hypothetical protein
MTSVIALWALLAAIATWGSAYYAVRDPHSTSWVKIVFAGILLLGFLGALAGSRLIGSDIIGEGLLAHVILFFIWPMAAIGAPLCLGSIIGGFVGMYRRRDRSPS